MVYANVNNIISNTTNSLFFMLSPLLIWLFIFDLYVVKYSLVWYSIYGDVYVDNVNDDNVYDNDVYDDHAWCVTMYECEYVLLCLLVCCLYFLTGLLAHRLTFLPGSK